MKLHTNAQTCPHCRFLIVTRIIEGQKAQAVAVDFHVDVKKVFKWARRFRQEGIEYVQSTPATRPFRTGRHFAKGPRPDSIADWPFNDCPRR
jgi:hypothetical protein